MKRVYSFLIKIFCVVFICYIFNSLIISCDVHKSVCNDENCQRCYIIASAEDVLKILPIVVLLKFKKYIFDVIERVIERFKNIIYDNLVILKVRLNE